MTASFIVPAARRRFCLLPEIVVGCAAIAAAGCSGDMPVARGFDSREVLPIRDATLVFQSGSSAATLLYSTGGSLTGQGASYWALDLATGATQPLGSSPMPAPSATAPYGCAFTADPSGALGGTLAITDAATGAVTDIDHVVGYTACPGDDGLLSVFQLDATGEGLTLATGPFNQLAPVQLPVDPQTIETWSVNAGGQVTAALVEAAASPDPAALGLYTIAVPSGAVTSQVPAAPASAAWAAGATPSGTLASSSLAATASGIRAINDHFVYPRAMADGGTTLFAGPFSSGPASELALFAVPSATPAPPPIGIVAGSATASAAALPQLMSWQLGGSAGASGDLMVWDDTNRQVAACPSFAQADLVGLLSPDAARVLFVTPQGCCAYQGTGPLALLTLGAGGGGDTCVSLVGDGVMTAGFAPDDSAMFWVTLLASGDNQLWLAAADGTGAELVGSGELGGVHFIPGTDRLEMTLDGDAVWVDVHDDPTSPHDIAEQVFGTQVDIIDTWVVIGYDFNTQDGTGTLGVVDRENGEKRLISPSVAQYLVTYVPGSNDAGAGQSSGGLPTDPSAVFQVIYQVRGRNPSAQDGIWAATIRAADLQ